MPNGNGRELKFSPRQLEIMKLLAETAMSDKELAWQVGINYQTVKVHLRTIGNKLRGHLHRTSISRMDITLFALANGYVDANAILAKYQAKADKMAAELRAAGWQGTITEEIKCSPS